MPPPLFFSYSHVDESHRDQLEVHLSALKRQGLIVAFHDRRIIAGSDLGQSIDANLNAAEVILLLVSPDFIASEYCYNREMIRAMERHEKGEAKVIPVVFRPCDWHDLPFGKLLGVPRDGKPITTWTKVDEAFLDVVQSIKVALKELAQSTSPAIPAEPSKPAWVAAIEPALAGSFLRSSNLRVKEQFSNYDLLRECTRKSESYPWTSGLSRHRLTILRYFFRIVAGDPGAPLMCELGLPGTAQGSRDFSQKAGLFLGLPGTQATVSHRFPRTSGYASSDLRVRPLGLPGTFFRTSGYSYIRKQYIQDIQDICITARSLKSLYKPKGSVLGFGPRASKKELIALSRGANE